MERNDLPKEALWELKDIYPDEALLDEDFVACEQSCEALTALKGTLYTGSAALKQALELYYDARLMAERLYVYTHMRRDENNADSRYQALCDRALGAVVRLEEATAFFSPEILTIGEETLLQWLDTEEGLAPYKRFLLETQRMRQHTLDDQQERLLAMAGEVFSGADTIFTMLNNADLRFPDIKNDKGELAPLTHGNYALYLDSRNRDVRAGAYEAVYQTYKKQINTIAATYATAVKTDVFMARARNFSNSLEAALKPNEVPAAVYGNLLSTVESHAPDMKRYLELRKKALGVDELRFYDLYVPLTKGFELELPYEQALQVVRKGLSPLGAQYISDLDTAFNNRWIDVYETQGKTSGAYSWGVYGTHPFVLLNYQQNTDNVFTIAHELGHAMHSYYSSKAQPYPTAEYVIFVAEVASTVNEMLLLQHLIDNAGSDGERAALLNHKLESIRGTVYRQSMFAAFERLTHELCENGEALTPERLNQEYAELNRRFYPGVLIDDSIPCEWARIPHFYRAFYVYQYATGMSAAVALSRAIRTGGPDALQKYLAFLHSGGSDSPLNLLRNAGVDLLTPAPVEACMAEFTSALEELEQLI